MFIDIDLFDEFKADGSFLNFSTEVKADEFFVGWMKPESGERDLIVIAIAAVANFWSFHIVISLCGERERERGEIREK